MKYELTEKFYNEYVSDRVPSQAGDRLWRFWHSRMFKYVATVIPHLEKKKILELGVGFGYFAQIAKKKGLKYRGIEMNQSLTNQLNAMGIDVITATVPPMPPDEHADVVWVSHMLEHMPDYVTGRALVESIYHSLDPGGYLVLISPDYLSWKGGFWDCDWSHGMPTTLKRCKQLLRDVGFTEIHARHHSCTLFQPILCEILAFLLSFVPVRLLDSIFKRLAGGRTYFESFMILMGWRQIMLIAKKS